VTSKPDFKVMVLLLVFMQLTRDLFAIAKFLLKFVHLPVIGLVTLNFDIFTFKLVQIIMRDFSFSTRGPTIVRRTM